MRWDILNPLKPIVLPTPVPGWEGVSYEPSFVLPTYLDGCDSPNANCQ
jgi:hypothetical protein